MKKFSFVSCFIRQFLKIWTIWFESFLINMCLNFAFIKWAYKKTLSSFNSKKKSRLVDITMWWIDKKNFDRKKTYVVFVAWIDVWTITLKVRTFKKAMISQLSMWAILLNMLMSIFFESIKSIFNSIFVLKLSIKWTFLIIMTLIDLSFLFTSEKYMRTITYLFEKCFFESTSRTKMKNVIIRMKIFEVFFLKNFVSKKTISISIFKQIDFVSSIENKTSWIRTYFQSRNSWLISTFLL